MNKMVRWPLIWHEDVVEVPNPYDMDDEIFLKHLERRHAQECKFEHTPVGRQAMDSWIGTYRVFHDRLHMLATPGQHDHYHVDQEEEVV